jgi:iron complex outermembrane receptor protein
MYSIKTGAEMQTSRSRNKVFLCGVLCAVSAVIPPAWGQDGETTLDVGTVQASASGESIKAAEHRIDSAPYQAPSAAPLEATQPTSLVNQHYIENNIISGANYENTVKFTPSVYSVTPNSSGLGPAESLSIRGFQDSQYNVMFDGMPFGDATDFHHTTDAYFTAHDLGEAQVDRGPGTAATIGNATFGGTVNLRSKDPLAERTFNPYATVASFGGHQMGFEADSGRLNNGLSYFVDVQHENSNGYFTNDSVDRDNLFIKGNMPVGNSTVLTFAVSRNLFYGYTVKGTTLGQIATYGANYGLNNDPTTQNYYGYNWSNYFSDFEYVGLDSDLGNGWQIANKFYSNAFEHNYVGAKDASDNNPADNSVKYYLAPAFTSTNKAYATDVPGKRTDAKFRAYGDVLRLYKDTSSGQFQFGVWVDYNDDNRYSFAADMTQGTIPVPAKTTGVAYSYMIHDTLTTIQPFVQYDWKATPELTLTPGVKLVNFHRDLNAPYNKTSPPVPADYGQTYQSTLPSLAAHYTIQPGWTSYAQVAKGYLAPNISVMEVQSVNQINPEQTWNYQIGTSWQSQRLTLGLDAYYIDFSNYTASSQIATPTGNATTYVNSGGAIYDGIEAEATYHVGSGFSLYGNFSINNAKYKNTNVLVAQTPSWVSAAGVIFNDSKGWYSSLMSKYYGPQYGIDNTVDANNNPVFGNQYWIGSFYTADFATSYTVKKPFTGAKEMTTSLKISNLFNNKAIDGFSGTQSVSGLPLYWTDPARCISLTISAKL